MKQTELSQLSEDEEIIIRKTKLKQDSVVSLKNE